MNKAFLKHIQPFFVFGILLINVGTYFFVEPLSQNLSDLGNQLGQKNYLILWGVSSAIYFYIYTRFFIKKSQYSNRIGSVLLLLSCCFMILSVLIPYAPYEFPQLSKWHTRIAMWGTVLYVLVFFHILTSCLKTDVLLFHQAFPPYCMLVVFDLLLYLLNGGVSTLLETTFAVGMSFYLYDILRRSDS